jgi:hypothetical protein
MGLALIERGGIVIFNLALDDFGPGDWILSNRFCF